MLAIAPEASVQPDPLADWLWEQATYLADEYYARIVQPDQRRWFDSRCPWCERMAELGRGDSPCPMCTHIQRLEADDEGPHLVPPDPIYQPDHRRSPEVRVVVDYPVGTTLREKGRQHGVGADRREWEVRLVMQSPPPTDQQTTMTFAEELGRRFIKAAKERPFRK